MKFVIAILILGAACAAYFLAGHSGEKAPPAAFSPVERVPFASELHEIGTIEALEEVTVLSRFAGEIVWMTEEGKLVERGEPLVRFETKGILEDIDSREKDLVEKREAVARARQELETAGARAGLAVRQEEIKLASVELERKRILAIPEPDDKRDAELTLAGAIMDVRKIELEMKSYNELAALGFVSEAKRKEKQLELVTKRVNHAKSKLIYDLTVMGATSDTERLAELAVADQTKRLNIARFNGQADVSISQASLDLVQLELENFEREMARRRDMLEWATVRAPVRGNVAFVEVLKGASRTKSPIQVGESRNAGGDLCVVCDTTNLRIRTWINESDVRGLAVGQKAAVQLPAFPGRKFEAVVSELAVVATDKNVALSNLALRRAGEAFVNVVQVKLDFVNLPEADRLEIRVGFTANVIIQTSDKTEALVIPWSAVQHDAQGQPYAEAGLGRERRLVKLGRSDGSRVEVLEGLNLGEQVLDPGAPHNARPAGPRLDPADRAASLRGGS